MTRNRGPETHQSEVALLACMLLSDECREGVGGYLDCLGDEPAFVDDVNQATYDVIRNLHRRGKAIDFVTVQDELDACEIPKDVVDLTSRVFVTYNWEDYAERVRDAALHRLTMKKASLILRLAQEGRTEDDTLNMVQQVSSLGQLLVEGRVTSGELVTLGDAAEEMYKDFQVLANANGKILGVPSGLGKLDRATGGFQSGDLVFVAARTSVGKTAFMLQVAKHALETYKTAIFFSLEMTYKQISERYFQSVGKVNTSRIRAGWQTERELLRAKDAIADLHKIPIHIDETPALKITELAAKARRHIARHGPAPIFIDYTQLVQPERLTGNRTQDVASITGYMKRLALETKCPVIAGVQLNREADDCTNGYKMLSYMRESGSIEQDGNSVVILRKPTDKEVEQAKARYPQDANDLLEVTLAKQRNGPTVQFDAIYNKVFQRFYEPSSDAGKSNGTPHHYDESEAMAAFEEEEELPF